MSVKNIENIYPLSPMQQGILFHSLYAPVSGVYVVQLSCVMRGSLNIAAFERAWQRVVERHAILRTAFVWEGLDEPLQVVGERVKLPLIQHDWRGLKSAEQEEQLESFLKADREGGFELSKAPLMRLTLFWLTDDTYRFVWSHHHMLLDGWSLPIIFKELFAYYKAACQGQDFHLVQGRPYGDYIAWLQRQDMAEAKEFWRQILKGFVAPTSLGIGCVRDSASSGEDGYNEQELSLSTEVTLALLSLARQRQVTLNTLMQGVWAILLSRYSGENDVVFGMTVSGRPTDVVGVESMVGLFMNTLPMRVQVPPLVPFSPWVKELQAKQIEMRRYEYSPLMQVQGCSEVHRGIPLFETILVFENYPVDTSSQEEIGDLRVSEVRSFEQPNYPLSVVIMPERELMLQIIYDRTRFDAATITHMLGHLQTLLKGVVANPEQLLANLQMLTEGEQYQLVEEWNDTKADYPEQCVQQLFEVQVKRAPEAVAMVFEGEQLTYHELNCRANQLAHYLRKLGVGPEILVGICVERSIEMIVGLLGILKAGGAYVPLDPAYPRERLLFMLEDTQAPVLLTQQHLLARLPGREAEVLCLDTHWDVIAQESMADPISGATPDDLAYVIYTSGSTGMPKGVAITHRAINRLIFNTNYIQVDPVDRVAQASNASFDAATFEIWGALLHGARLVGIPKNVVLSPLDLAAQIREQEVSVLFLTTALFNQLASEVPWAFNSLCHLLFGGEAVEPRWVRKVLKHGPPKRLLHVYGPTESTTFSSWHLLQEVPEGATTVPIGRPIANTQLYLLDAHLNPVPVGVSGELYIGGDGLARGYFNRPELTAERFIPHPFSDVPGARLYQTGDVGRYRVNGIIEFLGRRDTQVKVRGFRIELGEIEAVLGRHTAVREAVVMARDDIPGDKRLVAYVVPEQKQALLTRDLRSFLKERLPDYMVPTAFVVLEALPLNANGKVDRHRLPAFEATRLEQEETYVAPRTSIEKELAEIWGELLGVKPVGIHENFFELGGHSLLLTQLASWLRSTFQVDLSLRKLFEAPTIAEMTIAIVERQIEQEDPAEVAHLLDELRQLSPEEVRAQLEELE